VSKNYRTEVVNKVRLKLKEHLFIWVHFDAPPQVVNLRPTSIINQSKT